MRTPTASELLQVWERGGEASAVAQSLRLIGASCDELDADTLQKLPLGQRDALLLQLHARLFGRRLDGVVHCPACDAIVEATFDADGLQVARGDNAVVDAPRILELHSLAHDVWVRFRPVDCSDLIALHSCADPAQARDLLLERCVVDVMKADGSGVLEVLPEEIETELAMAMAAADPQADLQLDLTCPDCAHRWQPVFDIARFLWQELNAWALHLLRDVDLLARIYHWSEADILAMSPRRRQAYLEQCVS